MRWIRFRQTNATVFALLNLFVCAAAHAAVTVYTDEASFLAAASTVTKIDFDDLTNNEGITAQYAEEGVAFEGFNLGAANARALTIPPFCMDNHSETLSFDTVESFAGGGGFRTSFTRELSAFGIWVGDLELIGGSTTVDLRSADDQSIIAFNLYAELGSAPCEWRFFGVVSDVAIDAVEVTISGFDYVLFDDMYFALLPSVPSVDRLGLGLVAFALAAAPWVIRRMRSDGPPPQRQA